MYQSKTSAFPLLLFLFSFGLAAQSPAMETTAEEVVVTGAKFARPVEDSPHNVTVIDSATVAQSTDLAQLLNEQAGIVINGAYANFGKDKSVFQRNGGNAFTMILIDGQPLLDPSSLGGAVDLRLLSLNGVQRIEILRGPQSLLYGSDAVAGVINLVTVPPSGGAATTSFQQNLHLRAAAQNYGTFDVGAGVSGGSEKIDYRADFNYFVTDGISEATPAEGSNDLFDADGASRENLSAGLNYHPNERLSIRPSLRIAGFDGDYDNGSFQDGDNSYENDLIFGALATDYVAGKTTISGNASRAETRRIFNGPFGPSAFYGADTQGELLATYRPASGNSFVTVGGQLRHESPFDPSVEMRDTARSTATTVSPYVQFGARLNERYLLEGGLRFNRHSNFGGQLNYSLAAAAEVTDHLTLRLAASSAFQSPTLDQLSGPFGANPDLQPQVATSIEGGASLRHPGGNYAFYLNVFNRRTEDVIVFAAAYENRDELRDNGVELTGNARLSERFRLNGYVSYVKGQLTTTDGMGGTTETDEFFRRPRTTGSLGLTFSAKFPFTARLSAHYTGERPDVFFNSSFERFEVELEPYLLVHAYAEYRLLRRENLRLFIDAKNLTNADFVEVTGFGVLGTTVRAGVSVKL